jgi:hypothetical protein
MEDRFRSLTCSLSSASVCPSPVPEFLSLVDLRGRVLGEATQRSLGTFVPNEARSASPVILIDMSVTFLLLYASASLPNVHVDGSKR